MPLFGCDVPTLLAAAKCFTCFSDSDLLKAQVRFRELIYSKRANLPVRTGAAVLAASVAWRTVPEHQRLAIDVAQLANDAVLLSATTAAGASPAETLAAISCYCGAGSGDIRAANEYLKCLIRQEG